MFDLRTTSWVGTVITQELELLIRPKVGLDNLLLMLDAGMPPKAWQPELFAFGTRPRLLPAVASFFARTVERTLGRGVRRDYRTINDRQHAVRGRIRFPELMRRPDRPLPMPVRYQDYTVDILENRAIKAALSRLLRVPGIEVDTRGLLIREMARLGGVAAKHVDPDDLDRIPVTRLNRYYKPALRLASVILRNLALIDRPGRAHAGAFLLDMNRLFQDFVTRRLRRQLQGHLRVAAEPPRWLDRRRTVGMRPDLEFQREGHAVLVGDLKYKILSSEVARASDYYQLLAYATAAGLNTGLLIYCFADEAPPPAVVDVLNTDVHLHAACIDLSRGQEALQRSIETVAALTLKLSADHSHAEALT